MAAFVALYVGQTINSARLVGVTIDPLTVNLVALHLKEKAGSTVDPALLPLERGRKQTIELILQEEAEPRGAQHDQA